MIKNQLERELKRGTKETKRLVEQKPIDWERLIFGNAFYPEKVKAHNPLFDDIKDEHEEREAMREDNHTTPVEGWFEGPLEIEAD